MIVAEQRLGVLPFFEISLVAERLLYRDATHAWPTHKTSSSSSNTLFWSKNNTCSLATFRPLWGIRDATLGRQSFKGSVCIKIVIFEKSTKNKGNDAGETGGLSRGCQRVSGRGWMGVLIDVHSKLGTGLPVLVEFSKN